MKKYNNIILLIFLLIIVFIILFSIKYTKVIESFDTNQDNNFITTQQQYYTYRNKSELTSNTGQMIDMNQADKFYMLDYSKPKGKQLQLTTPDMPMNVYGTNDAITEDEDLGQLQQKCKTLTSCNDLNNNPKCGFCQSTNQFEAGDTNGPYFNVCPSGWVSNATDCIKQKEQNICSQVTSCQTMTGDANICGWCASSGKAFVATKNSEGILVPKYDTDICGDSDDLGAGLVPPGQCSQFNEEHPCIDTNMDTGPHSDTCLDKLWTEAGGTSLGTNAPDNNQQQKQLWNTKGWNEVFNEMKTMVSDANSNNWELVNQYYKGVYGKDPDPCDPKFSPSPLECYQKLFTTNGCLSNGNAYPNNTNYNNYKTQSQSSFIDFVKGLLGMSHNNSVSFDERNTAYGNCYGGQLQAPPPLKPGDQVKYTGGTFYGKNSVLIGYICSIDNGKAKVFWSYISGPDGNPHYLREGSHSNQVKISLMGAYCGQVPLDLQGQNVPSEIDVTDLQLVKPCADDPSCTTGSCDMQNIVYVYYSKSIPGQFLTYNITQNQIRDVIEKAGSLYPSARLADYSDIQYLVNGDFGFCSYGWVNQNGTFVPVLPSNSTSNADCGGGVQKVYTNPSLTSKGAGAYLYIVGNPADIVSKLSTVGLNAQIVATVGKKSYTGATDFMIKYSK